MNAPTRINSALNVRDQFPAIENWYYLDSAATAQGVGGRRGRTLTAAVLTVFDSLDQSGGLFGLLFSDNGVVRGGGGPFGIAAGKRTEPGDHVMRIGLRSIDLDCLFQISQGQLP